jgi:ketosteroid isomerase-like protein
MRHIIFLLFIFIFIGCQSKQPAKSQENDFNLESIRSHILEMNKSYSQRFMTNDTAFYTERYCEDAEVYCPALPAVKGRDAIREFFYSGGNNKETVIELPPGNIYGSHNLVVEEGTYNFPDGKGGSVDKGKFIALWKQEDGLWKLYREIWNTDLPPAPSAN